MDSQVKKEWRLDRWLSVALVAVVLGVWELRGRAGGLSALFFPPPSTIVRTLVRLVTNGELASSQRMAPPPH